MGDKTRRELREEHMQLEIVGEAQRAEGAIGARPVEVFLEQRCDIT